MKHGHHFTSRNTTWGSKTGKASTTCRDRPLLSMTKLLHVYHSRSDENISANANTHTTDTSTPATHHSSGTAALKRELPVLERSQRQKAGRTQSPIHVEERNVWNKTTEQAQRVETDLLLQPSKYGTDVAPTATETHRPTRNHTHLAEISTLTTTCPALGRAASSQRLTVHH